MKNSLPKALTGYKTIEDSAISVNGLPARLIGGNFTHGEFHVRNLQLIAVRDGQSYVVTGTALESTWGRYQNLFKSSFLTFALN
jgi:hypothetical protein